MDLPILELSGSPQAIGEAFGEGCRTETQELYQRRLNASLKFALDHGRAFTEARVLDICRRCLPLTEGYDPIGYAEFAGIARGAGLSLEQLFALQGMTDLRDLLGFGPAPEGEGCSSFIIGPDRAAGGQLLLGQNWDLQTDNLPYVRLVHRVPDDGPETWALTLTGCLTLIGINAAGIAVGNTNLQTNDARVGVQYLSVLHRALRCRTLAEAVAAIVEAPRVGAHYYYVAGPDQLAVGLECSATCAVPREVASGTFVHCNHALTTEIAALEVERPTPSSHHRQSRLSELLQNHAGSIGLADLKRFLSDHEGGPDRCLCRHDYEEVSTNAVVILSPATREIHCCRGQAHEGEWVTERAG